jgi:hypothetical protein
VNFCTWSVTIAVPAATIVVVIAESTAASVDIRVVVRCRFGAV